MRNIPNHIVVEHWKRWHVGCLDDNPIEGKVVYALIEEDTEIPTEPELVEAVCRYKPQHNPPFIWEIKLGKKKTDNGRTIAGGSSVYAWRYKDETFEKVGNS